MVVWYKIGLELLYRQRSNERAVRQHLALFLGSGILFWPLFDSSHDSWSWRLNIVVPISLMGRIFYKVNMICGLFGRLMTFLNR